MSLYGSEPDLISGDQEQRERWLRLARTLPDEFARTAVQREREGILPREEIQTLKDAGLINLVIRRQRNSFRRTSSSYSSFYMRFGGWPMTYWYLLLSGR